MGNKMTNQKYIQHYGKCMDPDSATYVIDYAIKYLTEIPKKISKNRKNDTNFRKLPSIGWLFAGNWKITNFNPDNNYYERAYVMEQQNLIGGADVGDLSIGDMPYYVTNNAVAIVRYRERDTRYLWWQISTIFTVDLWLAIGAF